MQQVQGQEHVRVRCNLIAGKHIGVDHPALEQPAGRIQAHGHCIGETLALYETLMHVRKVVPRFRLVLVPEGEVELEAQINLRARRPLRMMLARR